MFLGKRSSKVGGDPNASFLLKWPINEQKWSKTYQTTADAIHLPIRPWIGENLDAFRRPSTKFAKSPAQFLDQKGLKNPSKDLKNHQKDTNPENYQLPLPRICHRTHTSDRLGIAVPHRIINTTRRSLLDIPGTFAMTYSKRPVFFQKRSTKVVTYRSLKNTWAFEDPGCQICLPCKRRSHPKPGRRDRRHLTDKENWWTQRKSDGNDERRGGMINEEGIMNGEEKWRTKEKRWTKRRNAARRGEMMKRNNVSGNSGVQFDWRAKGEITQNPADVTGGTWPKRKIDERKGKMMNDEEKWCTKSRNEEWRGKI